MAGIKVDKRDKVFSQLVRERASWRCEVCGKHYPEGNRRGLECSHFYSRRYKALRWNPLNAAAHCTGCHMKMGGNPIVFAAWIYKYLGEDKADELRLMSQQIGKFSKPQLEDIHQNLKTELKRVEQERANGTTGRIEFKSPYE